jgi:hypothetical protein
MCVQIFVENLWLRKIYHSKYHCAIYCRVCTGECRVTISLNFDTAHRVTVVSVVKFSMADNPSRNF